MKITDIRKQLKRPDRVSIFVDDKYRFSLSLNQLALSTLAIGQEINDEKIATFLEKSSYGMLLERALNWALRRHHSKKEIEDYLARKTDDEAVLKKLFKDIKRHGFVDDARFAEAWVHQRRQKGSSTYVIRGELIKKGVDEKTISEALEEGDDELMALKRLIDKKKDMTRYKNKQKFMSFLSSKGYRYQDIKKALEEEL